MSKISSFQIIFIALFVLFIIAGTLTFSGIIKLGSSSTTTDTKEPFAIWGSFDQTAIQPLIDSLNGANQYQITYKEIPEENFDQTLVGALAAGTGPDLFILPDDKLWSYEDKIIPIPYQNFPQRTFLDTFIDGSQVFLGANGVEAFPFMVDPMVLYWNKDLFSTAAIASPPQSWSQFSTITQPLTIKNADGSITQSAIDLGRFENITHAKDIFSLLLLQTGNPITSYDQTTGALSVSLGEQTEANTASTLTASYALDFFTSFANPSNLVYTWNKGLGNDQTLFLDNKLAMYLGYASELGTLRAQNPNLNFDVTFVPQSSATNTRVTFGKFYGLAIPKSAKNEAFSIQIANDLTSADSLTKLGSATNLPPIRKDMYGSAPADPYQSVFYDSALQAQTWIDPEPDSTNTIFTQMVNAVISGGADINTAVITAADQIKALIN